MKNTKVTVSIKYEIQYNLLHDKNTVFTLLFPDQGRQFSAFSLISDFFTSTPLKSICKISTMEHVSYDFMVDSDFQKK